MDREMASHPLGWGLIPRSWSRFGDDPNAIRPDRLEPTPSISGRTHRRSSRRRSSRNSQESSSSSSSYHTATCHLPLGNPLSIFDSRLSTWRHFGPISTGDLVSARSSPNPPLDHFVAESSKMECVSDKIYASAPDLSTRPPLCDDIREATDRPLDATANDHLTEPHADSVSAVPDGAEPDADIVTEDVELIMRRAVDRGGRPFRYRIRQLCHPRLLARRDVLAAVAMSFTSLPVWVYRLYDVNYLVTAIQTELLHWNDTWHVDRFCPELAVPFSYWLVQNLPMPGILKSRILGIDHVVPRLRALLDIIRRSSTCVCVHCDASITSNRYIICLVQEGSFQTYVNPAGVLHDIVTVSQVSPDTVNLFGSPSEEFSWFPGYSWTIANCSGCHHHLGWLFNAVRDDLRPRRFWGVRREAIISGLMNSSDWRPCL